MPPPTQADLIFSPLANHNFSKILGDLKRSNLSISNRLRSIRQDSAFVQDLSRLYNLPLVANERCGSWYIPPALKTASAYFKSTDGHMGQWGFSTRRLNLHLLEVIGERGGCVVVDSTRRGKGMPDALSKTLPVWCCVVNRVLWPERGEWHGLFVPPAAVGESERSQIEERISGFVESFLGLGVDLSGIRGRLSKPLRPIWRTQDDGLPEWEEGDVELGDGEFYPVVCCTSSRRVVGAEMSEGGYIQGAGDDTENWAHGLTAEIWWRYADELLATAEGDLPGFIEELVAKASEEAGGGSSVRRLTDVLYVSALPVDEQSPTTCVVKLVPETTEKETWIKSKTEMHIGIGKSKTAGRNLRHALPTICEFVKEFLDANMTGSEEEPRLQVVVACETGKDLAVGVALGLDCWCFDDSGRLRSKGEDVGSFTKTAIRVRLGRIMTAMPEANPSRTTLQSVNSFLMDWQR
ncbi:initiator tRNA phosphoribosyl transferase [Coniochaeta ligniaria NRRL 30616]|uniref:Initiator tRNA phosphoribosyl transferase n=1 Tax=Coniochaeta ligniaria NRRL 30616 TaxID=1408157 RepID=A0A1J7J8I0_9PEZI|nr:initiator tRNA phosphoribosyl transferase [Coniochaeta ligniaria NRRL 30616]